MNWDMVGIWLGALTTLFLYSFLYRDNPFYKFAEHLFVGMSAGYWLIYSVFNVLIPNWWDRMLPEGGGFQWVWLIPGVFAVFMLARMVPKIAGLSRFALAMIVGTGAGLNMVTFFQSNALAQVKGTIFSVATGGVWSVFSSLVLVVGVVSGLVYFFFSKAHTGMTGRTASVGITILMVAFGASFGYTIMARISLLVGRVTFLLEDWLPTIPRLFGIGG
ncbi:MAG: hypothetical protein AVO35_09280 [Candidatus Aegiribacteria sp. MLS_C]|nr:MAG: hypothetical protein AVO35_09280 [Candidatus Aegiribacteria sp. MLS_C]